MRSQIEEQFDGRLSIEQTRYGEDVIVFSLAGELDLATTSDAWRMIEPALDEPRAMVVLDLTELEFISVKGVGLLYGFAAARRDKETMRLLPSLHEGVNRVLAMTGVGAVIPVVSH
jgi:anti-anti-sigma factor